VVKAVVPVPAKSLKPVSVQPTSRVEAKPAGSVAARPRRRPAKPGEPAKPAPAELESPAPAEFAKPRRRAPARSAQSDAPAAERRARRVSRKTATPPAEPAAAGSAPAAAAASAPAPKARRAVKKRPAPREVVVEAAETPAAPLGAATEEERIESSKYAVPEVAPRVFEEERFLFPESYDVDRVRLHVKDPDWLFAHWDVSARSWSELRESLGERASALSRLTLTVEDPGNGALSVVLLPPGARSWYVRTRAGHRFYRAQLGFTIPSGEFRALATSNTVTAPRVGPSPEKATFVARFDQPLRAQRGGQPFEAARAERTAERAARERAGRAREEVRVIDAQAPATGEARDGERGGASDVFRPGEAPGGASDAFSRGGASDVHRR
jgi:hypothetical protein